MNAFLCHLLCMKVTALRGLEPVMLNTVLLSFSFPCLCDFKVNSLEHKNEELVAGIHPFFQSQDVRQRFFAPVSNKERAKPSISCVHVLCPPFLSRAPDEAYSVIPVLNDWSVNVVILHLRALGFYFELPPSRPPDVGGCNSFCFTRFTRFTRVLQ